MICLSESSRPCRVLPVIAFVAASVASAGEVYSFRVAFENVRGVEHLVSGNVAEGIRLIESDLQAGDTNEADAMATLCGAYVLNGDVDKAGKTCAAAVERFPGDTAYNNRGVLRAFIGDMEGAREDFDRARPASIDEYMAELATRDVGLVASGNHEMLLDLTVRNSRHVIQSSIDKGADIETLGQ